MISRRRFTTGVVIALTPLGSTASAQEYKAQQKKIYRVGVLLQSSPPAAGFQPGILTRTLRDLGYFEGQNIVFDRRGAEGKIERFSSLAAELVALKPDAIVAETTAGAIAAKHATTTIPIIMVGAADPVGSGLVVSLARPGGNVTGVANLETELHAKGVELLRIVVPKATRIAGPSCSTQDNPGDCQDFQPHGSPDDGQIV